MRDIIRKKSVSGRSMVYVFPGFAKRINITDIAIFSLYAILVIFLTWPLITRLNSIIPGLGSDGGDGFIFIWDFWWVQKQLAEGRDIFFSNYIFYPNGVNLVFHTLILGQSLLGIIFSRIFSIEAIFNSLFLFSMWLSSVFGYLLAKKLWRNRSAAIWCGLIFAFCPYVLAQARGHFNLTMVWPFPAIGWLWLKTVRDKKIFWPFILGLVIGFLCLNDWQYFVFGIIFYIFLLFYALFFEKGNWVKKILLWFLGLAVAALIFVPFLLKSFAVASEYLPKALLSEVKYWSADVLSWVIPVNFSAYFGDIGKYFREYFFLNGIENQLYLGFGVLFIFLISFFIKKNQSERGIIFWQLLVIFFAVLSLGPLLKIAGQTEFILNDVKFTIALPYMMFYKIPYLDVARVPSRFSVLLMLCLGIVFSWVVKKMVVAINNSVNFSWETRKLLLIFLFIGLGSVLWLEYSCWPMSMQELYVPKIYGEIKKDRAEFTIMELPLWWASGHRSAGKQKTIIQYWQIYHEKRILNGSVSRVPDAIFDYYLAKPGIKYLVDVEHNILDDSDSDKLLVEKVWRDELGVKYIVVHKKYFSDEEYYKIRAYLENGLGLGLWYEDEGELGYKI